MEEWEPEMERLHVSEVARSSRGFYTAYVHAKGNLKQLEQLGEDWIHTRENFIKRHLAQYVQNPTYRRRLALIAWAYDPEDD